MGKGPSPPRKKFLAPPLGKTVTEKVAILVTAGTGPARTKVRQDKKMNYATTMAKVLFLWENYGTHRHDS